jgi:hypothetical protein
MKTERVKLTPEAAKAILSGNTKNRPVSQANLKKLKTEINEGRWKLTHQGICVSKEGNLIDGQHRVLACIETGKPIEVMLTTGAPEENFKYIDTGKKRGTSDILAIEGFKHHTSLASLVTNAVYWENGVPLSAKQSDSIDPNDIINFAKANEDRLYLIINRSYKHKTKFLGLTVTSFVYYLLDKIGYEEASEKLDMMISGVTKDKHLVKTRDEFINLKLQRLTISFEDSVIKVLHGLICSFLKRRIRIKEETSARDLLDEIIKLKHR